MNVCVYQTSGGKDITQPLLPETKAIVLLILEQLQKDGFEFLYTKPVLKNSKPKKIKEIKRNNVRLLYFVADNTTYIQMHFLPLHKVQVCDVASSAYLPHSGKSRLGCEAGTVMKFVFIPFVYCWRAGSD